MECRREDLLLFFPKPCASKKKRGRGRAGSHCKEKAAQMDQPERTFLAAQRTRLWGLRGLPQGNKRQSCLVKPQPRCLEEIQNIGKTCRKEGEWPSLARGGDTGNLGFPGPCDDELSLRWPPVLRVYVQCPHLAFALRIIEKHLLIDLILHMSMFLIDSNK